MGILKNILIGAAGFKTYQNIYNRPTVIPPPGYVIKGMKQVGLGRTWKITYSKNGSSSTSFIKIDPSYKGLTMGSDKWDISWP